MGACRARRCCCQVLPCSLGTLQQARNRGANRGCFLEEIVMQRPTLLFGVAGMGIIWREGVGDVQQLEAAVTGVTVPCSRV